MSRFSVLLTLCGLVTGVCQAGDVSFARDVRPILSGRCFKCHGPDENSREADLRLDQRQAAVDDGAIVPGAAADSSLVERLLTDDPDLRMPPAGDPLTAEQIATLQQWIDGGAEYEQHWAYLPPADVRVPQIRHEWPRTNAIDNFVQARLPVGQQPAPAAAPAVLLRRLSLDLTGLPPTVAQVAAFEQDPSPARYEAAVDRLLQSPHFGEKWALHWLDLARYADSNGYQHDDLRSMWPYRDWVIDAFNRDLPFNEFTTQQLAGDLLPDARRERLIATGFHRNVPTNFSGGTKVDEVRANVLHDRVSTTGQVWLGMTLECCQCHDHKFDPISQREYYQLYAYFNQAMPEFAQDGPDMFRKRFIGANLPVLKSPATADQRDAISRQIILERQALENAKPAALAQQASWEPEFLASGRGENIPWKRLSSQQRGGYQILQTVPPEERSAEQRLQVQALLFYDHRFTGPYEQAIDRLEDARDALLARTMVMQDARRPTSTQMFLRGNYLTPGESVTAGVPAVLHALDQQLPPNRLGLARWLTDPANPLTARVTVNRLWAEIFGRGIVSTLEDFGMQSAPPTHPQLLDWLARQFVRDNWSMKRLIKTMVMSSTYRQSSVYGASSAAADPDNVWLTRGPRFRLSGELIRDNVLAVSGLLSARIGGPSVYPPQPAGLWKEISGADVKVYPTSQGEDRYRRGVYTFLRRGNPNPVLLNFDGSNRSTCVIRRDRSNTPVQALTLLNGPTFVEAAHALAALMDQHEGDDAAKIRYAFRRAVARRPIPAEVKALLQLRGQQGDWFGVAQVILNLDELVTKS